MRWIDSTTNSMDFNLSKLWKIVEDRGNWHAAVHGHRVGHDLWLNSNIQFRYSLAASQLKVPSKDKHFRHPKITGKNV